MMKKLFCSVLAGIAFAANVFGIQYVDNHTADGILNYTVTATRIFRLLDANLTAEATASAATNSLADGGTTLGLLGLGILGIFFLRRKKGANRPRP